MASHALQCVCARAACVHAVEAHVLRARACACVYERDSVCERVEVYLTDNLSHVKRVAHHFSNVLPARTRMVS